MTVTTPMVAGTAAGTAGAGVTAAGRAPTSSMATLLSAIGIAATIALAACGSDTGPTADRPPAELPDHRGRFVVSCAFSHAAPDDPLVHPGVAGAAHLHEFFGNVAVDEGRAPFEAEAAELATADTTCETAADRAAYWVPALVDADGARIAPTAIDAYYRAGRGVDPAAVEPYPPGLAMIVGSRGEDDGQPVEVVGWACSSNPRRHRTPPDCEGDLRLRLTFPDCWDGETVYADDHRGHVAFSGADGCPDDHPVSVPQLEMVVRYPTSGGDGLSLSSGSVATAHADFWNLWEPDALEREIEACLHRDVVCGSAAG